MGRLLWLFLLVFSSGFALAQDVPDETGQITVRNATTTLVKGVYMLNAEIECQFTPAVLEALDNGVPLVLEVNIDVMRTRSMLWDADFTSLKQRYQLEYHALTEQYLVKNLNSGTQLNFPSREAAILVAGNIANLPILDQHLLEAGQTYTGNISARLEIEALPSPLLLQAYLSPQWHLESKWFRWPLQS